MTNLLVPLQGRDDSEGPEGAIALIISSAIRNVYHLCYTQQGDLEKATATWRNLVLAEEETMIMEFWSYDINQQIFLMVLSPAQSENSTEIFNFANEVRYSLAAV